MVSSAGDLPPPADDKLSKIIKYCLHDIFKKYCFLALELQAVGFEEKELVEEGMVSSAGDIDTTIDPKSGPEFQTPGPIQESDTKDLSQDEKGKLLK